MSLRVTPDGRVVQMPARPPASAAPERADGCVAEVIHLARARRSAPAIPAAVWEAMDRASRTAEELEATGRGVRFHEPADGGRVVVELVDDDDGVLRPLSLGETISFGSTDGPPAA